MTRIVLKKCYSGGELLAALCDVTDSRFDSQIPLSIDKHVTIWTGTLLMILVFSFITVISVLDSSENYKPVVQYTTDDLIGKFIHVLQATANTSFKEGLLK